MKFYDWEYERVVDEWVPLSQYLYFSESVPWFSKSYVDFLKENFWTEDEEIIDFPIINDSSFNEEDESKEKILSCFKVILAKANIGWDERYISIDINEEGYLKAKFVFDDEKSIKAFLLEMVDDYWRNVYIKRDDSEEGIIISIETK